MVSMSEIPLGESTGCVQADGETVHIKSVTNGMQARTHPHSHNHTHKYAPMTVQRLVFHRRIDSDCARRTSFPLWYPTLNRVLVITNWHPTLK